MGQLDTSSSSTIHSEHPQVPAEAITYMESDLFKAAEDGEMEPFNMYQGGLHCLVDGRKNTALHIYSRTGGRLVDKTDKRFLCFQKKRLEREFSINFVHQLVNKCPSLLLQPNDKGEIPLHIAARRGHYEIVKFLVERAKEVQPEDVEKGTSEATSSRLRQMLRMRDEEENTAFHMAAGSRNVDVVRLLVKELDPDFSFSANKSGETPLYIAAKRSRNHRVVSEILNNCESIDYGGPDGTTALHAAVMVTQNRSTMEKLITAKNQLTQKTDDKGRTPLHYAAYFRKRLAVKLLLEADASAAYIADKKRGMSALHMAAWHGDARVMNDIISHCPGCCEIVDNRGWNFLHIAVAVLPPTRILKFFRGYKNNNKDLRNLLEQKDIKGNTPFHVMVFGPAHKEFRYRELHEFFLSIDLGHVYLHLETEKTEIQKVLEDIANDAEVPGSVGNFFRMHMKKEEDEEDIPKYEIKEKVREAHLLVATLVATVTFAAAFTMPGGYKNEQGKNEQGTAILSHDSAFKAFVITDTLAFVSSVSAIFIDFLIVLLKHQDEAVLGWFYIADCLTFCAMVEMVVAFSTGTYAVLKSSSAIAIATCSLGLILFPGLLVLIFLYGVVLTMYKLIQQCIKCKCLFS